MPRQKTFYGSLQTLEGKQGPHVVPFSSIEFTLKQMSVNSLIELANRITVPDKFEEIIKKELEVDVIKENEKGWGNLGQIVRDYRNLYDEFYEQINKIRAMDNIENNEELIYETRLNALSLINLNPYATYGWATEGGATEEWLAGKGERKVNLEEVKSLDDIINTRSFDFNVLASGTFNYEDGFKSFLQSLFVNVRDKDIDALITSKLDELIGLKDIHTQIEMYIETDNKQKLFEIARYILDENEDLFHSYLSSGQFIMKDILVCLLYKREYDINKICNQEGIIDIFTILCECECGLTLDSKIKFINCILRQCKTSKFYEDLIDILQNSDIYDAFSDGYEY